MSAITREDVRRYAETIWPEYEINVCTIEGRPEVGGVPPDATHYAVAVRDRNGRPVDKVTADTMERLSELLEQKLNRG
jgi:hypothetical protein